MMIHQSAFRSISRLREGEYSFFTFSILIAESSAKRRVISKRSSDRKFDSRHFDVLYSWRSSTEEIFVRFFVHGVFYRVIKPKARSTISALRLFLSDQREKEREEGRRRDNLCYVPGTHTVPKARSPASDNTRNVNHSRELYGIRILLEAEYIFNRKCKNFLKTFYHSHLYPLITRANCELLKQEPK